MGESIINGLKRIHLCTDSYLVSRLLKPLTDNLVPFC